MVFNKGAFVIAASSIAIAGVGLYMYSSREKDSIPSYTPSASGIQNSFIGGKRRSRKHKKTNNSKTKKH